jgi:uncharacterized protein (DUF2252 family)
MARSAHRFVRGSTAKFYEWLDCQSARILPEGPSVWICGDCHIGNLGPVANAAGRIEIQIRDLDQTVIGNPSHDLLRLGLSLASAARGSDLPGVTTAKMLEQMIAGYAMSFRPDFDAGVDLEAPKSVALAIKQSATATWRTMAVERIEDTKPDIPLGKRFWPTTDRENEDIRALFTRHDVRRLATMLRGRDDDADVDLLDAAYWVKGCSSLGRLRYAALLSVTGGKGKSKKNPPELCLMDIKEAARAEAPRAAGAGMPSDQAERVIAGAISLSPHLGKRMCAGKIAGKSVFVRELLPQDLKIEIDRLTRDEAMKVAGYLAAVVGKAHSRQMDAATRSAWQKDLNRDRSQTLDAPGWLWNSVVELLAHHERAYLEHCRKYALEQESDRLATKEKTT